ncbi:hypothetical protein NC653_028741 [Populus alba x Populus x berolinensis]|uniref:Uncharacterized protein n=1 Tax=Populus alba x Populus x berolinensis TaxID=444605 RepID=A0AAD6Q3Q2_9ROSI|nr:hypothetical protein NC653_028741 [Populus alba x Populus x berolinensis]
MQASWNCQCVLETGNCLIYNQIKESNNIKSRSQPGQQTEKEASPSGPMKTLLLRWLHHDVNELKEMFLILAQNLPLTNFVAHSNLFPGLKVALEASIGSEHCCLRAKISFPAVSASGCGAEEEQKGDS